MINIKESFLKLTEYTTPFGKEENTVKIIQDILPYINFEFDQFDNMYYIITNNNNTFSDVMFTSHIDTINTYTNKYTTESAFQKECKKITHDFSDEDFIKTDKTTNLGADDKAGVVLMCNMISENVPGLYYFFIGEESGCVGSSQCVTTFYNRVISKELPKINKVISLDRRGYDSVITYQTSSRCCSDEFANELANRLNEYGFWYKPDNTGIYTDSAEFVLDIPECTNLSVGYFNEHTLYEEQDIEFLEYLGEILTKIDFNTLPVKRNINDIEYDDYRYSPKYYKKYSKPASSISNNVITNKNINNELKKIKKDDEFFENTKKNKRLKNKIYDIFSNERGIYNKKISLDEDFYNWYNKMTDNAEDFLNNTD